MPNHMQILNYRMFGDGHPVLFLHGFLESISMWNYLDLISLNRKVVLVDLPGHGKSYLPEGEPTISVMSNEVVKLLNFLKIDEIDVVGHSMGGYVGLEMVNQFSVNSLVLLNSNFWEDSIEKKQDRIRVAELVATHKNHFVKEAIPSLFSNDHKYKAEILNLVNEAKSIEAASIAYASLAMRSRKDWTGMVDKMGDRLSIIQGELDSIIPHELMRSNKPTNANYFLIKNAGHMSHIEAAAEVQKILEMTLKKNGN